MFKPVLCLAALASASAFAPLSMPARGGMVQNRAAISSLNMQTAQKSMLSKALFTTLDKDGSGAIDKEELRVALGNNNESDKFLARGDLNGDGEIDYAEYERVMNMDSSGDEQDGNLYVRNAIKFGLLSSDSVMADNAWEQEVGSARLMVGNKGFDPLGLATDTATLKKYREAELKHGRLAMLAAAGWPVSELVQPYLSKTLNLPDLLAAGEKAPSVLNGGLDKVNPLFFLGILVFTATVESMTSTLGPEYKPGDLGFDPLGLYTGKDEPTKRDLELKELNNGRVAMLAITAYAFNEFSTNVPVIMKTPFLFKSFL